MPKRFSWVLENKIAGMERPGLFDELKNDYSFLTDKDINVIINLEEEIFYENINDSFRIKHIPIDDFKAPRLEDFVEFVSFVKEEIDKGNSIVVHCHAGMGRTNLMIASYIINEFKIQYDKALEIVRESRPIHFVTEEQVDALRDYYFGVYL